ncbi:MAG: PTS sugar transporter subunit IIA [Caulobacteraceae bacterium]
MPDEAERPKSPRHPSAPRKTLARPRLTSIAGGASGSAVATKWTGVSDLIAAGAIGPRVAAATKRQALSVVAEIAARALGVKAPRVFDALMEREAAGSTGVGHGVATPHARLQGLSRTAGVFVRLQGPVEFGAVDDQPVDLIFALLAPADSGSEHLRALARVARLLRKAELRSALRRARSSEEIRLLLVDEAEPSAA